MTARTEILGRLRATLARPDLRFPPVDAPPLTAERRMTVTCAEGEGRALAERFGEELEALYGSYELVATAEGVRPALIQQLQRWRAGEDGGSEGTEEVLAWAPELLPVTGVDRSLAAHGFSLITPEELRSAESRVRVRDIRFGVTGVEAAFASTGSMLMVTGSGKSRSASLLPLYHIALIPFSRLYPTIEAWLAEQREAGTLEAMLRGRANLTLITGPSKSADIEMNLTLGVHGPQVVHAILFDDLSDHSAGP